MAFHVATAGAINTVLEQSTRNDGDARLQGDGNEPTLRTLQKCALSVEGQLRMCSAFDRFVVQEGRFQPTSSEGASRVSQIPPRRLAAAPTRIPRRTAVQYDCAE